MFRLASLSRGQCFLVAVNRICGVFVVSTMAVAASGQSPLDVGPSLRELLAEPTLQLDLVDPDTNPLPAPSLDNEASAGEASPAANPSDEAAQRPRDASIQDPLAKLRRPLGEIRLGLDSEERSLRRPTNEASQRLEMREPERVTASAETWLLADRYPVSFDHRPLYYQQPNLERCGQTLNCGLHQWGYLQNAASGITFLVNTMVLPYRLATERPDCPIPHQGDCRACQSMGAEAEPLQPGACGWVSEAAAFAGFTFLLL